MVAAYSPPASLLAALGLSGLPAGMWTASGVFPLFAGQDIAIKRSEVWSTLIKRAAAGRERRTPMWSYPMWRYAVPINALRDSASPAELPVLEEFFLNAAGQAYPFNYVDPDRCIAVGEPVGTGTGSRTVFQLYRAIRNATEPVIAPYTASGLVVSVNGTPTGVTHNGYGVITFASAPANGSTITWSGYYYFLCRMEQDEVAVEKIFSGAWGAEKLAWTSIKP